MGFFSYISIGEYHDKDWNRVEEDDKKICDFCEKKPARWDRECFCCIEFAGKGDGGAGGGGDFGIYWCDDCKGKEYKDSR